MKKKEKTLLAVTKKVEDNEVVRTDESVTNIEGITCITKPHPITNLVEFCDKVSPLLAIPIIYKAGDLSVMAPYVKAREGKDGKIDLYTAAVQSPFVDLYHGIGTAPIGEEDTRSLIMKAETDDDKRALISLFHSRSQHINAFVNRRGEFLINTALVGFMSSYLESLRESSVFKYATGITSSNKYVIDNEDYYGQKATPLYNRVISILSPMINREIGLWIETTNSNYPPTPGGDLEIMFDQIISDEFNSVIIADIVSNVYIEFEKIIHSDLLSEYTRLYNINPEADDIQIPLEDVYAQLISFMYEPMIKLKEQIQCIAYQLRAESKHFLGHDVVGSIGHMFENDKEVKKHLINTMNTDPSGFYSRYPNVVNHVPCCLINIDDDYNNRSHPRAVRPLRLY